MCNKKVIGKCSECGGIVSVPTAWHGIYPPVPQCESCGAVADLHSVLPVVPMKPHKPWTIEGKAKSGMSWQNIFAL